MRRRRRYAHTFICVLLLASPLRADDKPQPRQREFLFTYAATISGLAPNQIARIWLPAPPSNQFQSATLETQQLPTTPQSTSESTYHNSVVFLESPPDADGHISLSLTWRIKRSEILA